MYMYMYSQFEFVNAYDHKRLFKSLVFLSITPFFQVSFYLCDNAIYKTLHQYMYSMHSPLPSFYKIVPSAI